MCFVGRENDIVQIKEVLTEGNNVIILGKHGIGRTNLIRHIAKNDQRPMAIHFHGFFPNPWGNTQSSFIQVVSNAGIWTQTYGI
jgi:ABC-type phosphate/phosphonate transport system ATPase subunit